MISEKHGTMKITEKDKVFLALLPALAVAAAYVFFFARPAAKDTARLEARLSALGDERQIRGRREKLTADEARLREELAALETQAAAEPRGQDAPPAHSAAGLSRLQEAVIRNGVRLISASLDAERRLAKKSGAQEALGKAGVPQPRLWTITVEASYEALTRLLDDFNGNPFPVIPETLSMRPGAGAGKPNYWTLTVCL
jgi:biotin carboxylase